MRKLLALLLALVMLLAFVGCAENKKDDKSEKESVSDKDNKDEGDKTEDKNTGDKNDDKDTGEKPASASEDAEEAAIDMCKVVFEGKGNLLPDTMPDAMWDFVVEMAAEEGMDEDDVIASYEESYALQAESLAEEFGEDYEIDYSVRDLKKLSDAKVEEYSDMMLENYAEVELSDATAAYSCTLEATIAGSEDEDTDEMDMVVIKIDGSWYCIDAEFGELLVLSLT